MKLLKQGIRMLIKDYKQSYFYIITIIISTASIFNLINTSNNQIINDIYQIDQMKVQITIFGIVCMAVLMIGYASYYFFINKTKEVGVISISGGSVLHTGLYLSAQNSIIQCVGSILGVTIGVAISPFIMRYIYNGIGLELVGSGISSEAVGITIGIVVLEFIYTLVSGVGYAYRKTIRELMVDQVTLFEPDKRNFKLHYAVYIVGFILPLVGVFKIAGKAGDENVIMLVYISFASFMGFITYGLPKILEKLRDKGKLYNKTRVIWIGNLSLSIRQSMIIIAVMISMLSITMTDVASNGEDFILRTIGMMSTICTILIMSITILYKVFTLAYKRIDMYNHLEKVGYTRKQSKSIIKKEMIAYFSVILIPTFVPLLVQVAGGIYENSAKVEIQIYTMLVALSIILTIALIAYIGYVKIALKRNVKY